MAEQPKKRSTDSRANAVNNIWSAALGMLVLCIPLCAMVRSAAIPIAIIVGAAVVTFYIWNSGEKRGTDQHSENETLKARIKELEDRLANVEVINRFEDRLAEKRLRQAEEARATPHEAPQTQTPERG